LMVSETRRLNAHAEVVPAPRGSRYAPVTKQFPALPSVPQHAKKGR